MSLSGPFEISLINFVVPSTSPGVYVLSRDGRVAHYVGRSDTGLASRLALSARGGCYTHFWYALASSPMEAYRAECDLYHRYTPSDNTNHPAVPIGTQWRCPIVTCSSRGFSLGSLLGPGGR
jgi:hypothetical protein